jgi:SEC-C motif-containing protein
VTCPCGKGESFEVCCGRFIRGEAEPETAEDLMRARYTAYALGEIDYVVKTHDPATAHQVDRKSTELWSKQSKWLGFELVSVERGGAFDEDGNIEFVARYKIRGVTVGHRERAHFRKRSGRWVFSDGFEIKSPPKVRDEARVGRNDPCPCGSGKKYKKCHGAGATA